MLALAISTDFLALVGNHAGFNVLNQMACFQLTRFGAFDSCLEVSIDKDIISGTAYFKLFYVSWLKFICIKHFDFFLVNQDDKDRIGHEV